MVATREAPAVVWHAPTDNPRGRVGLFGVAERPVLLTRLGNAGGGKGPQVRSDDRRAAGLGSGDAYNPELRPGNPGNITCPSEGTEPDEGYKPRSKCTGLSRREQAGRPTGSDGERRVGAVPPPQPTSGMKNPITSCPLSPWCSVCEMHDPTGVDRRGILTPLVG